MELTEDVRTVLDIVHRVLRARTDWVTQGQVRRPFRRDHRQRHAAAISQSSLPLLTVMFNNRAYGNDEAHREAVAKARGRPVEQKVVGIRMANLAPDFARIAQGFDVWAEGPIDTADAVGPAVRRALRVVKDEGRPALVDVITRP